MLSVDDVVSNPHAIAQFEVSGVDRDNQALPTLLVDADSFEEAKDIYILKFHEHSPKVWANEVGKTAPFQYGDPLEVQVTSDDLMESWSRATAISAKRYSPNSRWEVEFICGWVGSNPLRGRAWYVEGDDSLIRRIETPAQGRETA